MCIYIWKQEKSAHQRNVAPQELLLALADGQLVDELRGVVVDRLEADVDAGLLRDDPVGTSLPVPRVLGDLPLVDHVGDVVGHLGGRHADNTCVVETSSAADHLLVRADDVFPRQ